MSWLNLHPSSHKPTHDHKRALRILRASYALYLQVQACVRNNRTAAQVLPTLPVLMDVPLSRYAAVEIPQYSVDFSSFQPMEPQVREAPSHHHASPSCCILGRRVQPQRRAAAPACLHAVRLYLAFMLFSASTCVCVYHKGEPLLLHGCMLFGST